MLMNALKVLVKIEIKIKEIVLYKKLCNLKKNIKNCVSATTFSNKSLWMHNFLKTRKKNTNKSVSAKVGCESRSLLLVTSPNSPLAKQLRQPNTPRPGRRKLLFPLTKSLFHTLK